MTRRWPWLVSLVLLALFGGGGLLLWLSQNLVQRDEEVYTGYAEPARRNPFYLADRLLTRLGLTVHSVRRSTDLPEPLAAADTLLVAIPTYALGAADSQRLLDWVAGGGHLIIGVQHEFEPGQGADHLLDPLQVRSRRTDPATTEPASVKSNEAMHPFRVRFHTQLRLNDAFWQQLRWGRGRVTLLTDLGPFTNERLPEHDHADFLWALLQQQERGGEIWLQYRMLAPSLAQLLWQHAWMPLAGTILTLLAALWRYSRRLGPILTPRSGEQRRLAEHLQASSRFLWRHGAGPALLQAARHHALRRLERRQPGSPPDAAVLDHSDEPLSERELIHTLQTLQRIDRHPP